MEISNSQAVSMEISRGRRMKRARLNRNVAAYVLLTPFLLFYLVFTFYPLVQGFVISFFKWNITGNKVFIGLSNYKELFGEGLFWESLWHTLMYVLVSTPIFMAGAFVLALIIDYKFILGRSFLRSVFFLPNVLTVSITAVLWLNMLQPYTGLVNTALHAVGIQHEVFWLADANKVWLSIIWVTFWWNTGYYMILYLAGMQDIPEEHYEAAQIDGASWLQTIRYITMPSLKHIHILVLFLQVVASFKIFGQVFLITEGGPGGASRTFIQYIYEVGFQRFFIGKASAASFVLFAIIMLVSLLQLKIMSKSKD
ncbi:carbohydrate ABC transporter permease [Paenibacillus hexagrammi]|uniref:Sugar ABC transporter permease n=1 Tax=Paenibacillus hexagrammi TaxID=2908839 RepID=A0ABY3SMQ9_9BACL|nr:sugar ABC transporter permease [Paenibacillus sp. YPD9-1]UJF34820.1 sugar ABC transporter permease [Paenibacillus sp. YPD9-1]